MVHSMAVSLVPLEDHLNNHHTKEAKVVTCEYCKLSLDNIIFWEHLTLHMKGELSLAPTPEKTEGESASNTPASKDDGTSDAAAGSRGSATVLSASAAAIAPDSSDKIVSESVPLTTDKAARLSASENSAPISAPIASAQSPKAETKISPVIVNKDTIGKPVETKLQGKNLTKEHFKSMSPHKEDCIPLVPSYLVSTSLPDTSTGLQPLQHPGQAAPETRQRRPSSPLLTTAKPPSELAASTIPFSSFFKKTLSPKPEPLKSEPLKTEVPIPEPPKIEPPKPEPPKPLLLKPEPPKPDLEKPVRRASGDKPKISLSEYSKIRQMSGDVLKKGEKVESVRNETPKKDIISSQTPRRSPSEGRELRAVTPEEKKLSPTLGERLMKERKISGSDPQSLKDRKVSDSGDQAEQKMEMKSPRLKLEISPDLENEIIKGNRGNLGKGDTMRPPTPLDRPVTPSVPQSPEAGSSRSTTPGDKMSRPTTPLDRPSSSSRRSSSDQKPRRLSEGYPKDKPKPVLTEELERQIIYGGALLKGKGLVKCEEGSAKVSPPPPNESPEEIKELTEKEKAAHEEKRRREQWNQDEKEKKSREAKLADIRKQIELRFQQEELERMKDKEAEKKRQEDLQKKIRIEEEKLRKEKEKIASEKKRLKQKKKEAKKAKHKRRDSEIEVVDLEDDADSSVAEAPAAVQPVEVPQEVDVVKQPAREKSPDQYEKLKLNFLSQRKQALENELRILETKSRSQSPVKSRSRSPVRSRSRSPVKSRSRSPVRSRNRSPVGRLSAQEKEEKMLEPELKEAEEQNTTVDLEDDEDDDLEAMMRKFQEKEQVEVEEVGPVNSLSFLMDSYGGEAEKKQTRSGSESPPAVNDEPSIEMCDDDKSVPISGDFDELDRPSSASFDDLGHSEDFHVEDQPTELSTGRSIPRGFDEHGHPLHAPRVVNNLQDERKQRAANSAAMDIMAPAKKSRGLKAATELQCSLCKEDGGGGTYYSAYNLLSHVFLMHRKKLLSRSRKVRGMTLACPEGCGFITNMSSDGSSIDYFTIELPKHLEMLCDHIRDTHTGEPEMETCQFCSLPLQHKENWSWQHLANHRDERRFYCDTCNNFPFRTEVHKCSGTGLDHYFEDQDTTPEPPRKRARVEDKDVSKTKSLEELAREVETGSIDMDKLVKRKNLGNLERFMCEVCDKFIPCLSQWLVHVRLEHLTRGQIKQSRRLKCFCCSWEPPRFEKGREIIGVNNLVHHLVDQHHSEDWQDADFEVERNKLIQIQRDMERRLEREREEAGIVVPRLPSNCNTCNISIVTSKTWRYHVLAHKFGQVFCASCKTLILGHHFQEHSATCSSEEDDRVKVKVENFRGDTWINAQGKKLKVNFEYDESEEVGSITIAKTVVNGNRFVRGHGDSHEEATRVLRDEVQTILTQSKIKDDGERKAELEKEDKEKLLKLFKDLATVDKENEEVGFFLEVESKQLEVRTRFHFTKSGKCKVEAMVVFNDSIVSALGDSRNDSVRHLASKIRSLRKPVV